MFYIDKNDSVMDAVSDARNMVRSDPLQAERFNGVADIRRLDDGSLHRGNEFRRVASIQAPLFAVLKLLEPEFMHKPKFYAWLDRNPEYCTYDRRKMKKRSDLVTFIAGKEV